MKEFETIFAGLERAWNAANGEAYASGFTEDADFVNIFGHHGKGRAGIAAGHDQIFRTVYAGSLLDLRVEHTRMLTEDVGLVHAAALLMVPAGPMKGELRSRPSAVMQKVAGQWRIAAFHNTLVQNPPAMHANGQATNNDGLSHPTERRV
jgi:uncharacterized protein (TIGR02246 family)